MHPVASWIVENARSNRHLLVPLLFAVFAAVANVHGPLHHQLLVTSVSWAVVCIPAILRAGLWSGAVGKKRSAGLLAGGFLALSQICDRAAGDKEGIWAAKVAWKPH